MPVLSWQQAQYCFHSWCALMSLQWWETSSGLFRRLTLFLFWYWLCTSQAISVQRRRGLQGAITKQHVYHFGCSVGKGTTMSEVAWNLHICCCCNILCDNCLPLERHKLFRFKVLTFDSHQNHKANSFISFTLWPCRLALFRILVFTWIKL